MRYRVKHSRKTVSINAIKPYGTKGDEKLREEFARRLEEYKRLKEKERRLKRVIAKNRRKSYRRKNK